MKIGTPKKCTCYMSQISMVMLFNAHLIVVNDHCAGREFVSVRELVAHRSV